MNGPHADQAVRRGWPPSASAPAAGILVHGRGGEAAHMRRLAGMMGVPGVSLLPSHASAGNV